MNHQYLTSDGAPSVHEITLHYVTTCLQLEQIDIILGKMASGMKLITGPKLDVKVLDAALAANDKAWERRARLAAQRTAAYDALFTACGGEQSRIDSYVSSIAKDLGVILEPAV